MALGLSCQEALGMSIQSLPLTVSDLKSRSLPHGRFGAMASLKPGFLPWIPGSPEKFPYFRLVFCGSYDI